MLFVFGYRAEQSNNLSEFIHNSSKYPNVNSCKVAVHFQQIVDKEDGTFDLIPNTEIVIARTAFKNNSSFYSVGQREVEFKDVAKILEEHNIDLLHNRFLILQGEVESIASMKPMFENKGDNGLSEYLEDIIGTERYKKPLFLIDERLAKLDKERLEKQTQCSLAELELKQNDENSKLLITMLEAENLYLQLCNYNQKNSTVICEGYKSKRQRLEKEKINGEDVAKKIEQLKTLMKELKDRLSKMPQWEDKIKTLALHEIPNEEMPPFKSLTGDELEKKSIEDVANEFMQMEEMLKVCKPETLTIEEINEKRAVSVECIKVFEDIAVKRDETCKAWLKLDYKRSVEFMEELRIINLKLKEIYQKITFGGHAELDWIDVDAESERIDGDDLTGFIGFLVRRTNDKWKRIKDLSGDEKTLSSLALVFAIRNYKPSPLYIMDDALDFKNSFIVANCINVRHPDLPQNDSHLLNFVFFSSLFRNNVKTHKLS